MPKEELKIILNFKIEMFDNLIKANFDKRFKDSQIVTCDFMLFQCI